MNKYVLTLLSLIFFAGTLSAQDKEITYLGEPSFKPGEELSYKLKYGFFTAAQAVIRGGDRDKKFEHKPPYHIVDDAKTAATFDIFYKMRNRYETYVNEKTLEPYFYPENRK